MKTVKETRFLVDRELFGEEIALKLDDEDSVVIENNPKKEVWLMEFEIKLLSYLDEYIQSIRDELEKLERSDALSDDEYDEIRQL